MQQHSQKLILINTKRCVITKNYVVKSHNFPCVVQLATVTTYADSFAACLPVHGRLSEICSHIGSNGQQEEINLAAGNSSIFSSASLLLPIYAAGTATHRGHRFGNTRVELARVVCQCLNENDYGNLEREMRGLRRREGVKAERRKLGRHISWIWVKYQFSSGVCESDTEINTDTKSKGYIHLHTCKRVSGKVILIKVSNFC